MYADGGVFMQEFEELQHNLGGLARLPELKEEYVTQTLNVLGHSVPPWQRDALKLLWDQVDRLPQSRSRAWACVCVCVCACQCVFV